MTIKSYEVAYNPTTKKYEATEKGNTSSAKVVYRWSKDEIKIGATIDPNNTSKFTKDASTLGKSYYLKHVLNKDNKVTESYTCAILKGKEYCLTAYGVEYGYAANPSDYTGNALLLKQIEDAKIEGIGCLFSAGSSGCNAASVHLFAFSYGHVTANVDDGGCSVDADGSSNCASF